MKELIFVRHAKSDWGNETLKDVDRHLNERGYDSAYLLSEWFAAKHPKPDQILSSTATRALSTAFIFARAMEFPSEHIQIDERVYETSSQQLVERIRSVSDTVHSLMVFGHNPAITNICNELSDELYFDNVPTCGMVSLRFDTKSWKELQLKSGKLNFYEFPKNMRD